MLINDAIHVRKNVSPSYPQQSYEAIPVGQKVQLLFSALTTEGAAAGEEGRQLAAVMLRRLITSEFEEFFPKVRSS